MNKTSLPALVLAGAITASLALPAFSCDPEDLMREYRSLCAVTHETAQSLLDAAAPGLDPSQAKSLGARVVAAKALCEGNKYDDGMKLAMRVARAIGNIEARKGLVGETFASASSGTRVAAAP